MRKLTETQEERVHAHLIHTEEGRGDDVRHDADNLEKNGGGRSVPYVYPNYLSTSTTFE